MIIHNMEMPESCNDCLFAVDGWCYAYPRQTNGDALNRRVRTNFCPLEEHKTTDRITLAAAMDDKAHAVFGMVAAADPLKPINVKMTYWKLYEVVEMLKKMEGKRGN